MKKGSKRYWYVDENGEKVLTALREGEPVPDHYIHGLPPLDKQRLEKKIQALRQYHMNKPKSETQKINMRLAKLNVPKSVDHRQSMSDSHLLRCERVRLVHDIFQQTHTYHECARLEKQFRMVILGTMIKKSDMPDIPIEYIELLKQHEGM